jgi:hypothetical protein
VRCTALTAAALAVACGVSGCVPTAVPVADLDPQATFAARQVHDGFSLDRLPDSDTGIVRPSRWIDLSGRPEFRVRTTQGPQGTLQLVSPARVVVHDAGAQPASHVDPSWDAGAIHLTLRPASGPPLRLGPFERIDGASGFSVLTRNAQTSLDLQGTYRATILDARDQRIGWFQVRNVEPVGARLFQGIMPGLSSEEQAGLVIALNSEIDWIENRVVDVHRGTSGGRDGSHSTGGR